MYAEDQIANAITKPEITITHEKPPAYGVLVNFKNDKAEGVKRGLVFEYGICIYNLADRGQVDAAESILRESKEKIARGTVADAERVYGSAKERLQRQIQRAMDEHSLAPMRVLS